jgi:hypothetical protein
MFRNWWLTILLRSFATAFGLVILWIFLSFVIGADRGFDTTDEGLYLLAADPPKLQAAWGFPFGWHTKPLFALVGNDIAAFRTLGALILVVSTGWLGWTSAQSMHWENGKLKLLAVVALSFSGSTAALIYYSSMLRTPSYNWLNLVSLVLASAFTFSALSKLRKQGPLTKSPGFLWLTLPTSLALFLSIPAKPSTLPIMAFISGLAVLFIGGRWIAFKWFGLLVLLIPLWVGLSVITGLWPTEFPKVFQLALQMPTGGSQTLSGGLKGMLLLPKDILAAAWGLSFVIKVTVVAAAVTLVTPIFYRRNWLPLRISGIAFGFIASLAVAGVKIPLVNTSGDGILGWANRGLVTASLMILVLSLLAGSRLESAHRNHDASYRKLWVTILLVLIFLPFVFSFGSSNGTYPQAAAASGLFLLAAVFSLIQGGLTKTTIILVWTVIFINTLLVGAGLIGGWQSPYRNEPLFDQTVSTSIGNSQSELFLSPTKNASLLDLREQAAGLGWRQGTPLVDISYPWNPGVPYFLGATFPSSLMLTIFDAEVSQPIVDFHLTEPYLDFPFPDSWILTTSDERLDQSSRIMVSSAIRSLEKATGLPFPESYSCISAGGYILWKPEQPSFPRATGVNCDSRGVNVVN